MIKISPEKQINPTKENISLILFDWNISDFEMEIIPYGVENTSIKIVTPDGKYVLRVYQQGEKTVEKIQEEADFVDFLYQENLPVAKLIPNKNNASITVTNINGINWASILMIFLEGEHLEKYNQAKVKQIGEAMAKMHLASQKYVQQKNIHITISSYENELLYKLDITKIKNKDVLGFLERAKKVKAIIGNYPAAIIHSDLTAINMLFAEDKLNGILDFNNILYRYLIEDVAVTAWHILKKNKSAELIKPFIRAYEFFRPLLPQEKKSLIDFMLLRNCFIGPVEIHLWGENSQQVKDILEAEKKILELKIEQLIS